MSNKSRILAPLATVVAAALALLAVEDRAVAHAHLKSATPAVDATVATSPTELDLNFSEDLNLKFSGVKLTGPDKTAVTMGDAMLANKNMTLRVPVMGALTSGTYTVDWHALSADGHKTQGSYGFTLKP